MRKPLLFVMCACFFFRQSFAQTEEAVRIKAGEDPARGFSPNGFYKFATFREGVVYSKDGRKTGARLNYHFLNEEMQFISPNGDTLAIADPFSIRHIAIDSSIFCYSQGYLEIVVNNESLKLAKRTHLNTKWEKIGGYGQASPSGSIRTPNKLILGNTGKELSINQDLIIQKESTYYWLDKFNTVLKATKANLLKLLPPDKKTSVEDYLKKNKTDFNKETDLIKLLAYSLTT